MLLGCVADDSTGATDLANTLVGQGMRTIQLIGVPAAGRSPPDADAVVVALKSRTAPVDQAVGDSLAAMKWLREGGAEQIFFKYCSTFDSPPAGNIGPVADALLAELGADFSIACPAFPTNKRTIYKGYLYAGEVLLNESGMQDHPLTPMTDANLVRVLGQQTDGEVGLVEYHEVAEGPAAIRAAYDRLRDAGNRYAIVDALSDRHLLDIGTASADLALVTGGSGVAMGLPQNFRSKGGMPAGNAAALPAAGGHAAVISGSCSLATLAQVAHFRDQGGPVFVVDPLSIAVGEDVAAAALGWAKGRLAGGPVLVAASAPAEAVTRVQAELGRVRAGELVEGVLAAVARGLVEQGVRRLVVAGGETSGAALAALGVTGLHIGGEIDPGVPWTRSLDHDDLYLALKSGNFGAPDFFLKAFDLLT